MGRSSSTAGSREAEFQVLLVASAFMSPSESKAWSNINRVRMFGGCVGVRTCVSMCVWGGGAYVCEHVCVGGRVVHPLTASEEPFCPVLTEVSFSRPHDHKRHRASAMYKCNNKFSLSLGLF